MHAYCEQWALAKDKTLEVGAGERMGKVWSRQQGCSSDARKRCSSGVRNRF